MKENIKKIFKKLYVWILLFAVILTVWNLSLNIKYQNKIYDNIARVPSAQVAIVLGASVKADKKPSEVLIERLDKSIELYRNHKVQKLLFTGDNSGKYYDEVNVMREYALRHNVKSKDIFLDHNGLRTLDSVYRSKNIFLIKNAILVTQRFHLPRALFLADHFDLNAFGYSADTGKINIDTFNLVREFLARYLAIIDVYVLSTTSKYKGKAVPIIGSGERTWDKEVFEEK
ncbi:MAG: YdcF family protein [Spirochaetia bacterium]|nr:YdcF family protein [Spirochaetia bacterium]